MLNILVFATPADDISHLLALSFRGKRDSYSRGALPGNCSEVQVEGFSQSSGAGPDSPLGRSGAAKEKEFPFTQQLKPT